MLLRGSGRAEGQEGGVACMRDNHGLVQAITDPEEYDD